jgi:hypothetical protein
MGATGIQIFVHSALAHDTVGTKCLVPIPHLECLAVVWQRVMTGIAGDCSFWVAAMTTKVSVENIGTSGMKAGPPPLPGDARMAQPERAAADEEFAERMLERLAAGDYSGAFISAGALLETQPRHEDALDTAQIAQSELRRLYLGRLGSLDRTPFIAAGPEALLGLSIDVRTGFVLSRVDGHTSLGDIVGSPGIKSLEALRILSELFLHRVIAFRN